MAKSFITPIFSLFFLLNLASTQGVNFNCSSPAAKCQALASYVPTNDTTYAAIKELFQVDSVLDLFGANGIAATSPPSTAAPGGAAVLVPFPCSCSDGRGVSDRRPVYTVKANDTLYMIATAKFGYLVEYVQIAEINKIKDPNKIDVGQKFWIPLPCSCDPVGDYPVQHLAHVVEEGSSVDKIAAKYGTTESVLLKLNNIDDPKALRTNQVLDVPIRVCNSSIRSDAVDGSLRVAGGKYAFTAGECVECRCSSSSWQLDCKIANLSSTKNNTVCVAPTCREMTLRLGDDAPGDCGAIRCDYGGYYNSSGLNITAVTVANQSLCEGPPPPSSADKLLPVLGSLFATLLFSV